MYTVGELYAVNLCILMNIYDSSVFVLYIHILTTMSLCYLLELGSVTFPLFCDTLK